MNSASPLSTAGAIGVMAMLHSIAVPSDGSYGFAEGVWASVPVRTTAYGTYAVERGFAQNEFAQGRIAATNAELVGERDTVKELLG